MKISARIRQAGGKARRFALLRFRKDYVARQALLRRGECNQCGNCCEILFRCPFLVRLEEGTSICSIYEDRPGQCAAFPVDTRCLSDVDFDCTFYFPGSPGALLGIEPAPRPAASVDAGRNGHAEPAGAAGRQSSTRPVPVLLLAWLLSRLR